MEKYHIEKNTVQETLLQHLKQFTSGRDLKNASEK